MLTCTITLHCLNEVCDQLAYVLHQVALELGSYIGYSAIRTARKLRPGSKLFGIDPNETHVRIARAMIEHAGLSDKVEIIQGILETSIPVSAALDAVQYISLQRLSYSCITLLPLHNLCASGITQYSSYLPCSGVFL